VDPAQRTFCLLNRLDARGIGYLAASNQRRWPPKTGFEKRVRLPPSQGAGRTQLSASVARPGAWQAPAPAGWNRGRPPQRCFWLGFSTCWRAPQHQASTSVIQSCRRPRHTCTHPSTPLSTAAAISRPIAGVKQRFRASENRISGAFQFWPCRPRAAHDTRNQRAPPFRNTIQHQRRRFQPSILQPGRKRFQPSSTDQDLCNHSGEPPDTPIRASNPLLPQAIGPTSALAQGLELLLQQLGADQSRLCSEPLAVCGRPAKLPAASLGLGEGRRLKLGGRKPPVVPRFAQPRPCSAGGASSMSSRLERLQHRWEFAPAVEAPAAQRPGSVCPSKRHPCLAPAPPPATAWKNP